jgi:Putative metallopeptidase
MPDHLVVAGAAIAGGDASFGRVVMIPRPRRRSALALRAAAICCAGIMSLSAATAIAQTVPAQSPAAQAAPAPPSPGPASMEAKVKDAVRGFLKHPRFEGMSERDVRDRVEFVVGNVMFATMHEVGHMLISEMGLVVLGREEDAADSFATVTGLRMNEAFAHRVLIQSARGWFLSDQRDQKQKTERHFYDEHGLDKQRAYNIVCLMVGGNPDKFDDLADLTQMPPERQGTCQGDFSNASWSWQRALAPHRRKPDQPKTDISVSYGDSDKYEIFATGFREIKLLETIAEHLSDQFVWRRPVGLRMEECGAPNANWDLTTARITVCYELAADFSNMYREHANGPTPIIGIVQ